MPGTGLARIADELDRFGADALLVTVDEHARPHTAPVDVQWAGDHLAVSEAGGRSSRNASERAFASLVWAPTPASDGYHLIVDGTAAVAEGAVEIVPTKVVLHQRPGQDRPAAGHSACGADCVVVYPA